MTATIPPTSAPPTSLPRTSSEALATARSEFDAEVVYLNTATMGLPLRRTSAALEEALRTWRAGRVDPTAYDLPVAAARAAYARLVGVDAAEVAVGSQVSVFVGLVAASLPAGSEVLTVTGDFTSVLFPFLTQAPRGVTVREVELDRLADAVTSATTLVAVSAVQSANGRVANLDAVEAACARHGTRILLDTTQAVGWLPIEADRYAYTVCGGYKWLLSPRGSAYLTVRPELMDGLVPHTAGWYAAREVWSGIYGSPLRLADDARRFDVSPAWYAWVGTAPAVELLADIGPAALHRHSLDLANRFRAGIGREAGDSAVVSLAIGDGAADAMAAAGIVGSMRAGRLRLAFHLCTSDDDVDTAVETLSPHLQRDTP